MVPCHRDETKRTVVLAAGPPEAVNKDILGDMRPGSLNWKGKMVATISVPGVGHFFLHEILMSLGGWKESNKECSYFFYPRWNDLFSVLVMGTWSVACETLKALQKWKMLFVGKWWEYIYMHAGCWFCFTSEMELQEWKNATWWLLVKGMMTMTPERMHDYFCNERIRDDDS